MSRAQVGMAVRVYAIRAVLKDIDARVNKYHLGTCLVFNKQKKTSFGILMEFVHPVWGHLEFLLVSDPDICEDFSVFNPPSYTFSISPSRMNIHIYVCMYLYIFFYVPRLDPDIEW